MLGKDGVAEKSDMEQIMPSHERLEKGAVAIIECFQEIPCDPCFASCRKGAIKPFDNINDLPKIDFDLCDGCSLCVAACPGLAIFIVDYTYSDDNALLKIPHEFVPLPQKDEVVKLLNRNGEIVCDGWIVRSVKFRDKTNVLWVEVPKEYAMDIRAVAPNSYIIENPLRKQV
ncbi:4Fe-4S binding protein [bacterium]|nr:4Fe-4S binding protein [bacterium]